jgi:hypothetical protein
MDSKILKSLLTTVALLMPSSLIASSPLETQLVPSESPQTVTSQEFSMEFETGDTAEIAANSEYLDWNIGDSSFSHRYNHLRDFSASDGLKLEYSNFGVNAPVVLAQSGDSGAASEPAMSPEKQQEMAALGEAMANPLSNLWLLFSQIDTTSYNGDVLDSLGEDDVVNSTLLIQPVLSIQLTEEWKTVFRPVIPVNSFETVGNVDLTTGGVENPVGVDLERETGLGDIVLWTAFSNQYKPPNIFGFGVTMMLDTATEDQLGTGKNSIGPMFLAFSLTEKWILGVVGQHWESVGGSDSYSINTDAGKVRVDRADVSLTDIQPVIRYRLSPLTNIGMAPNWRYNHETDEASIPIGLGFDTLIKIGKIPVKIGMEAYHYIDSNDNFGGDNQIRLLFIPVIPSPGWSKTPIF